MTEAGSPMGVAGQDGERCWLCGQTTSRTFKASNLPEAGLASADFKITDSNYGVTGRLVECSACGFIRTASAGGVLQFYVNMQDEGYEASRAERALQARKLLGRLGPIAPGSRLLDVGAGSGILVEEAAALGYLAEGVEPSSWLCDRAKARGLRVHLGVLPVAAVGGTFDVVCLVDVLEHVTDPLALLEQASRVLAPDGRLLVVTPDVKSLAARLLGARWWHFRIAHVGYFSARTLRDALRRAGLELVRMQRPGWYFTIEYLVERAARYLPFLRWLPWPRVLLRRTIPLNLLDSLAAVAHKAR